MFGLVLVSNHLEDQIEDYSVTGLQCGLPDYLTPLATLGRVSSGVKQILVI